MSSIGAYSGIAALDLTLNTSERVHTLGDKFSLNDGRVAVFVKAGASNLVPGTLLQSPAEVTAHQNLTPTATAAGALTITTSSTVTVTANQYAGGKVLVTVTPGQGYVYKIKSHPAATAAAVTLTLEDPIQVALTTSSHIDLVSNEYNGVIINPTTPTGSVIGAAQYPITAGNYGFAICEGEVALLADSGGAITVGGAVVASNAVAGAVEALTGSQPLVGNARSGIAASEYGPIKLAIA